MKGRIAEAAALYRAQRAEEQGRATVAMIAHKAAGEIPLAKRYSEVKSKAELSCGETKPAVILF